MTQEQMNVLVPEKLRQIEEEHNVTVLYAAESGSRAWGFASPDSDFDVRFIYKRPQTEYLRLNPHRDVIELPIDDTWDVSGWDLNKTLRLLHNSNPGLYEWIGSPICYCSGALKERISPLMQRYFSSARMIHHYQNIATNNIRDLFSGEKVSPKRYFYALRAVLACGWIEQNRAAPPVPFSELVDAVLPMDKKPMIEYLLEIKKTEPEKAKIEHIEEIDFFLQKRSMEIRDYMDRLPNETDPGWDALDKFFLEETMP